MANKQVTVEKNQDVKVEVQIPVSFKSIMKKMMEDATAANIQTPVYWKGNIKDRLTTEFPKFDNEALTWKHLTDDEVQVEFSMKVNDYTVYFGKADKVIAGFICKNDVPEFGALSAQGVFKVLNKLTGTSISKLDGMYKAANPLRKDGKAKAPKTMAEEL